MYLHAITFGYAVPLGNFDASIHSVFHSAMNLRPSTGDGLLTLVISSKPNLPQGIRLDSPEGFSFEKFQIGEPAFCRDGILHIENSHLTVQLSGAWLWKCDLPALKFDIRNPAVSAAWRFVWDALNERQRQIGSEIIANDFLHPGNSAQASVSRKAGEAMHDLMDATRRYVLADNSAVRKLIGLGAGLTPTGDDLLVGYLAGLWCTVRNGTERIQFISSLGKSVVDLSPRTNDISWTYLYHAVQGQVSSQLANLAEAICIGGNLNNLFDVAENAMQVGHTSGMETVTGLLIGLAAWDGIHILSD